MDVAFSLFRGGGCDESLTRENTDTGHATSARDDGQSER